MYQKNLFFSNTKSNHARQLRLAVCKCTYIVEEMRVTHEKYHSETSKTKNFFFCLNGIGFLFMCVTVPSSQHIHDFDFYY